MRPARTTAAMLALLLSIGCGPARQAPVETPEAPPPPPPFPTVGILDALCSHLGLSSEESAALLLAEGLAGVMLGEEGESWGTPNGMAGYDRPVTHASATRLIVTSKDGKVVYAALEIWPKAMDPALTEMEKILGPQDDVPDDTLPTGISVWDHGGKKVGVDAGGGTASMPAAVFCIESLPGGPAKTTGAADFEKFEEAVDEMEGTQ